MREVHADPLPLSHEEELAEHPSLQLLDFAQLKKLRSISHSIRSLGFLWGISGLASVYFGLMMLTSHGDTTSLGLFLVPYGIVITVVGPYSAWARPAWGRVACMVLSIPPLANPPYGVLLGILSLIALARAEPLFGDGRIPHKAVEAAYKARGG